MCSFTATGHFFVLVWSWFFFREPDINLGLTAPITIISHQQHGESEKRN